jgi:hypothetical protein
VNRRDVGIALLTIYVCIGVSRAAAWELVTKEELKRESTSPRPSASPAQSQPGAPTIEVEQPDPTKPIKPPVTIRVLFKAQAGSTIDPKSFRAKYGWLGLDVTDRITSHAKIDASGLIAENADVPAGSYKITLQIADNLQRIGIRVLDFTVR